MAVDAIGLDVILDLGDDHIFKDRHVVEQEICVSLAQQYEFFDYYATHWAEHYAQCESIVPQALQDAVVELITSGSCILRNWLKYFWVKKKSNTRTQTVLTLSQ
jgi:hypothetical protein